MRSYGYFQLLFTALLASPLAWAEPVVGERHPASVFPVPAERIYIERKDLYQSEGGNLVGIYAADGKLSQEKAKEAAKPVADQLCRLFGHEAADLFTLEPSRRAWRTQEDGALPYYVVGEQGALKLSKRPMKRALRINEPIGAILTSMLNYKKPIIERYWVENYEFSSLTCIGKRSAGAALVSAETVDPREHTGGSKPVLPDGLGDGAALGASVGAAYSEGRL